MTFGGAVFWEADFLTGHGTLAATMGTVEGAAFFGVVPDTASETVLVVLPADIGDEGTGASFILALRALNAAADIVLTTLPSLLISFICSADTLFNIGL